MYIHIYTYIYSPSISISVSLPLSLSPSPSPSPSLSHSLSLSLSLSLSFSLCRQKVTVHRNLLDLLVRLFVAVRVLPFPGFTDCDPELLLSIVGIQPSGKHSDRCPASLRMVRTPASHARHP